MSINFIERPFFGCQAAELVIRRDLKVVDEKANALTYASTELLLAFLCVAEVVETVARACFYLILELPWSIATGNFREGVSRLSHVVMMNGYAIIGTIISLVTNLFSKLAVFSAAKLVLPLMGEQVHEQESRMYNNIKENKEQIKEHYAEILAGIRGLDDDDDAAERILEEELTTPQELENFRKEMWDAPIY